jgi:hypothetical protein
MLPRRPRTRIAALAVTAAVTITTLVLVSRPADAATQLSRISNLAPGLTHTRVWGFPSSLAGKVLHLNLLANGATRNNDCELEVTRTSWQGSRYTFVVKNVGNITCSADVLISAADPYRTWSTGTINGGSSKTWHWNNANPLNAVYFVGLSAPSECSLQVTRTWWVRHPNFGEREFYFTVRNRSATACTGTVLLGRQSLESDFGEPNSFPPGLALAHGTGWVSRPDPAGFKPAVFSVEPLTDADDPACKLEISRPHYTQTRTGAPADQHPGGTTSWVDITNIGSVECRGSVQYTKLA